MHNYNRVTQSGRNPAIIGQKKTGIRQDSSLIAHIWKEPEKNRRPYNYGKPKTQKSIGRHLLGHLILFFSL